MGSSHPSCVFPKKDYRTIYRHFGAIGIKLGWLLSLSKSKIRQLLKNKNKRHNLKFCLTTKLKHMPFFLVRSFPYWRQDFASMTKGSQELMNIFFTSPNLYAHILLLFKRQNKTEWGKCWSVFGFVLFQTGSAVLAFYFALLWFN